MVLFNVPFKVGILWYLTAYAYCLGIYCLASFVKGGYKALACITPILIVLYLILGRYSIAVFGRELPYYYSSNFLFAALPSFTVGFWVKKWNISWLTKANVTLLSVVSLCFLLAECFALSVNKALNTGRNDYLFNVVIAFLVIYYVSHFPTTEVRSDNFMALIGRRYSLYIYVFHGVSDRIWKVLFARGAHSSRIKLVRGFYSYSRPVLVFITALALAILVVAITGVITNATRKKREMIQGA